MDKDLYLICDVIGRAGEVEILDVDVPDSGDAPAPAAPGAKAAAPPKDESMNVFWEIMQRRPPMYR